MAAYEKRSSITVRYEYVIRNISANWVEVHKALEAARSDYQSSAGTSNIPDDAIWFIGDEDALTIYWERSAEALNA